MLLNLDLFAAPSDGNPAAHGGGGSMLDQIRTLTAMGYLGGHGQGGPLPVDAGGPPPPQMVRPMSPPYGNQLPPNPSVIPPADAARHTPSESQDENEE